MEDTEGELRRTKLTRDHVFLNPSSRMSVKLAVQVYCNLINLKRKSIVIYWGCMNTGNLANVECTKYLGSTICEYEL